MVDRLRVAVVGAGGWGAQHARIFSRRPDTELVAIVGRDEARTAARAAEYGTRAYTDIDRMLAAENPGLVTVCLPNEGHFEPTLQLARTGIPLLVEKPLVFDLGEADRLLEAAAASGAFFAINFNHRYAEPVVRAKAAIDAGELGQLVFATWRFGGEANLGESPHANLIETQCHGFDLLEHLVGPDLVGRRADDERHLRRLEHHRDRPRVREPGGRHHARLVRLVVRLSGCAAGRAERHGRAGGHPRHGARRSSCRRRATRRRGSGGPGTSTTRPGTSTRRSTGTSTRCSRRCGPARSRRCTHGPAGARSRSRTR